MKRNYISYNDSDKEKEEKEEEEEEDNIHPLLRKEKIKTSNEWDEIIYPKNQHK